MTTEIIGYRCTKGPITELSFDPKDGWDNEPISCWRGAYIFPPDEPTLLDASTPYELGFNEAIKKAAEVCEEYAGFDMYGIGNQAVCVQQEILALRPNASAEPVESEPVAWMTKKGGWVRITDDPTNPDNYDIPLYLHPTPNAESEMTFEKWIADFHIGEHPQFQTIRDFAFAAWNAAMEGTK